ncbi:glycosyltransferase [Streptomyces sp. NPDC002795]|uniref:glycosyltransferase n=1 Tax=Streptomyces sp. NPDC002795 TaxID=3364665 RepID=UPI00369A7AC4
MSRRRRRSQVPVLSARQHRSGTVLIAICGLALLTVWTAHHALTVSTWDSKTTGRLSFVWLGTFLLFAIQVTLYHLDRPMRVPAKARERLDRLHVSILMPTYNEDPGYLKLGLESFLQQTRRPDSVHVVDDGSTTTDYADVRDWWLQAAHQAGVETTWQRMPNGGKRHAQGHGVEASPHADVYITVDSDSYLDPRAVEEILKPFSKRRVQSVAGIVIATNNKGPSRPVFTPPRSRGSRKAIRRAKREHRRAVLYWRSSQLLARTTDLWFVTSQMVDRSGQSAVGAVMVNSGPLAAYRAAVVRDNLGSYLNETFMGRGVAFSDDSMLTLYAQERGLTVQQSTAIVFTAMPERWNHFGRMYLRWMRGSTIRSIWRMRYLSMARPAFWLHAMRWTQMVLTQLVTIWLLVVEPVAYDNRPPLSMLWIPFLLGWAQGLRYLGIIRTDERIRSRLLTWLMMPLAIIMAWTWFRWLRWYGIVTCAKTGWGTRQNGAEVSLAGGTPTPQPSVSTPGTPLAVVQPTPGVWDEASTRQPQQHWPPIASAP